MFPSINISLLLKCFIFIPLLLYNILIINILYKVLINAKIECFLKNKDTFCFVLQILFVPL